MQSTDAQQCSLMVFCVHMHRNAQSTGLLKGLLGLLQQSILLSCPLCACESMTVNPRLALASFTAVPANARDKQNAYTREHVSSKMAAVSVCCRISGRQSTASAGRLHSSTCTGLERVYTGADVLSRMAAAATSCSLVHSVHENRWL